MTEIAEATQAATSRDHVLRLCSCFLLLFLCCVTKQLHLQARARETRGFTNYSESEWVTKAEELPCLPGGFSWICPAPTNSENLRGADFQFRMRKVLYQPAVHHCATNPPHPSHHLTAAPPAGLLPIWSQPAHRGAASLCPRSTWPGIRHRLHSRRHRSLWRPLPHRLPLQHRRRHHRHRPAPHRLLDDVRQAHTRLGPRDAGARGRVRPR